MKTTSLYVLRQTITPLLATTAVAVVALLLERLLRLLELPLGSDGSFLVLFKMLINLLPHYLGLALPAAFALGMLLAFNRLSQGSELVALNAVGIGLHRLLLPIMGLALVLTLVVALIFGFLQPYGRYAYRALVHAVTHASLSAALESGAFIQVDDMTFMAEQVSINGRRLGKVFVHEQRQGTRPVTMTARDGVLREAAEGERAQLTLKDGVRVTGQGSSEGSEVLRFGEIRTSIGNVVDLLFRERGDDEREMTLLELWPALQEPPPGVRRAVVEAEFHGRLVRIATTLILPLLAIPLGLVSNRGRCSYGIACGLIILVLYHSLLQFGESLTALGRVSPWLGLWTPLAGFALGSGLLFYRASFRIAQEPLEHVMARFAAFADPVRLIGLRVKRQS